MLITAEPREILLLATAAGHHSADVAETARSGAVLVDPKRRRAKSFPRFSFHVPRRLRPSWWRRTVSRSAGPAFDKPPFEALNARLCRKPVDKRPKHLIQRISRSFYNRAGRLRKAAATKRRGMLGMTGELVRRASTRRCRSGAAFLFRREHFFRRVFTDASKVALVPSRGAPAARPATGCSDTRS